MRGRVLQDRLSAMIKTWPEMQLAFEVLLKSALYAEDAKVSPWEFGVELEDLCAAGLAKSDLRWLMRKGFAKHAAELTARRAEATRLFRKTSSLTFSTKSCFILTPAG